MFGGCATDLESGPSLDCPQYAVSHGRLARSVQTSLSACVWILWRSVGWTLRKEVIQPHLPVRLPCYDLAPIADRTLGASLPFGLGQ